MTTRRWNSNSAPASKFHNGDPVTAADVVYTYNTVSSPETRVSVPSNFVWIDHAEAIDDHTVRVTLKRVFPAAVEYVAMVLPIWPQGLSRTRRRR